MKVYLTNEIKNLPWDNVLNNSNSENACHEYSKHLHRFMGKIFPSKKIELK